MKIEHLQRGDKASGLKKKKALTWSLLTDMFVFCNEMDLNSYSLVPALCSWWLGPAAGTDVSPVPFPGFAAPTSFPSPTAPVAASSLAVPAAAEKYISYKVFCVTKSIYEQEEKYFISHRLFLGHIFGWPDQHQQGHVLTLRCSCSWTWCWRIRFSCCFWNSFMRSCFWICCCFWMRNSSCCNCRSHTLGSEPMAGILTSVRKSSGDAGSSASGTSGLTSTENMVEERLEVCCLKYCSYHNIHSLFVKKGGWNGCVHTFDLNAASSEKKATPHKVLMPVQHQFPTISWKMYSSGCLQALAIPLTPFGSGTKWCAITSFVIWMACLCVFLALIPQPYSLLQTFTITERLLIYSSTCGSLQIISWIQSKRASLRSLKLYK